MEDDRETNGSGGSWETMLISTCQRKKTLQHEETEKTVQPEEFVKTQFELDFRLINDRCMKELMVFLTF